MQYGYDSGESNKFGPYSYELLQYPEKDIGYDRVVFLINVTMGGKGVSGQTQANTYDIPDTDLVKNSGRQLVQKLTADAADVSGATMRRLSKAIVLYMPNSITQATNVDWSSEDFTNNITTALAEAANATMDSGAADGLSTGLSVAAKQILNKSAVYQNATRLTAGNSKEEMLFRSVSFREFEFSYVFAPKSETEVASVIKIIRMFKHHMLPEFKDNANFLYLYPSEFNVKYYSGSEENQFLARHMTAVLTAVNVDYTPNGQWNTFGFGAPQQINMSLRFRELGVPTKESVPFDEAGL
jgi:hypothetical protein